MARRPGKWVEQLEPRLLLHGEVLDFGTYRSAQLDNGSISVQVYGREAHVHGDQLYHASLRSVYRIDQRGNGSSTLELAAGHVARMSFQSHLAVRQDLTDALTLTGDWSLEEGVWQDDEYLHRLTDGEAMVSVANKRPHQNPYHALDTDADNFLTPGDVLLIVNDLNQQGAGQLGIVEPQVVSRYVDTSGDGLLSPLDALRVVNYLNANGAGPVFKASHEHRTLYEVPPGSDVPRLSLEVRQDPLAGWNLSVELEAFSLSPERASSEAVFGEGHLHLYVDGIKTARLYETEFYLGTLSPGVHQITVQVSANDHASYAVDGVPIQAATTITVPPLEPSHHHPSLIQVDTTPAPGVSLTVTPDVVSGWNLRADVDNFLLAPQNISTSHVPGEGHMHLYIDGVKITRLYGEWFHIARLSPGRHAIRVELSANNHATLLRDGLTIGDTVEVDVPAANL